MPEPADKKITIALCTYNRAGHLPGLVTALRRQKPPIPFDILIVDNNSTDDTQEVLSRLAVSREGALVRVVKETRQGIVFARNRAIDEAMGSTYLAFIDDDELPDQNWLQAAVYALDVEGADCVGGAIRVRFPGDRRPAWLEDKLLGFLGEVNYGYEPFWIVDRSTPVWSGNIAYRIPVFAGGLRFDYRYNRVGLEGHGGEDNVMFSTLVASESRIRYRPDMVIEHFIEEWKLKRSYFLKLHFAAGRKYGQYGTDKYERSYWGVPSFMLAQAAQQWGRTVLKLLKGEGGSLRQAMNAAYALGMIDGRLKRRQRN